MLEKMTFLKAAENREKFFIRISHFLPPLDERYILIEKAYNDAKDAFRGKYREGGERYFEHLRAVALILIDYLRVKDYELIIAALLHDIVEDISFWTIERVKKEYGLRVAQLVEWLTKPAGSDYECEKIYHDRFYFAPREFFLIKLADRLHNILTLDACPPEKRARKIEETKRYYLPFAEKHLILFHEIQDTLAKFDNEEDTAQTKNKLQLLYNQHRDGGHDHGEFVLDHDLDSDTAVLLKENYEKSHNVEQKDKKEESE